MSKLTGTLSLVAGLVVAYAIGTVVDKTLKVVWRKIRPVTA